MAETTGTAGVNRPAEGDEGAEPLGRVAASLEGEQRVERVQLGVRMEVRMVKVLKGLAEFNDLTLGQLLEKIVLHSFEPVPGEQDLFIVLEKSGTAKWAQLADKKTGKAFAVSFLKGPAVKILSPATLSAPEPSSLSVMPR